MRIRGKWAALAVAFTLHFSLVPTLGAPGELADLTLEDLMNLEVTSVSKAPEKRARAAAAIAVVTGDDVRRSGATSLPAALRGVPGLHVGRVTSSEWAVSSRGFADLNSGLLLVLVDGRSVYTPLFSGVFWDAQDVFLEDLDRIEVIRGPGASLWGANATNGVINVVSRSARDTQGIYLEGGGGTEERGFGGVRYGGKIGDSLHYRVYGKYFDRDATDNPFGPDDDDWRAARFGFRTDWDATERDTVTFQGDIYQGEAGQLAPALSVTGIAGPEGPLEVDFAGGNVLGRWRHVIGEGADLETQLYYDRTHRDDPTFRDDLDTLDLSEQLRVALPRGHDVVLGIDYRAMLNHFDGRGPAVLRPDRSTDQLASGFVQDQFDLVEDVVHATIGTKLEYNEFSGFEWQPTARLAVEVAEGQIAWGAVSRAVRTPTRIERDVFASFTDPDSGAIVDLLGSAGVEAEELTSYELGYRFDLENRAFFDVAAFYNRYDSVITLRPADPEIGADGVPRVRVASDNGLNGEAYGTEVAVTYAPCSWSRIAATYSYLEFALEPEAGVTDLSAIESSEDATPHNQVDVRIFNDLPGGFAFDVIARYVDNLGAGPDQGAETIGKYFNVDLRAGWFGPHGIELSLVGQNLVEESHREFLFGSTIERAVYGKVAWRY